MYPRQCVEPRCQTKFPPGVCLSARSHQTVYGDGARSNCTHAHFAGHFDTLPRSLAVEPTPLPTRQIDVVIVQNSITQQHSFFIPDPGSAVIHDFYERISLCVQKPFPIHRRKRCFLGCQRSQDRLGLLVQCCAEIADPEEHI